MEKHDWISERVILGIAIVGGYFLVALVTIVLSTFKVIPEHTVQLVRDIGLTVGPILGLIAQAVFRNDKVDKMVANTAATLADKAPNLSNPDAVVMTPSTPSATDLEPVPDQPTKSNPFAKG